MLVWIENPFDNLPTEGYRPQRYWLMARAFVEAGHSVVYWTSDFSHANKAPRRLTNGALSVPFAIRYLPTKPYFGNVSLRRILSHRAYARTWLHLAEAEARRQRPDLIIASSPPIGAAVHAVKLGRRLGVRTVIDVQDAWPETFYRLAPKFLFAPLRAKIRRAYREADAVSGVCERYRRLTGRADYLCAYLGIDPGSRPARSVRNRRLVYAGNLGRSYDLQTVIRAVERDPRLTLDIAGTGDFRCTNPRVRFHGYLDQTNLRRLFETCDIGVIPMSGDSWVGVPNKLFDYTAADLAVVSSLEGETADILARSACGATYRPGDVTSLLEAVETAAGVMPGVSRRLCETEFDAHRIYADYVNRIGG